tara:strand:- start:4813 stop:5211 length:399 start_codon:yes stop_codon:yes gene_type:complete
MTEQNINAAIIERLERVVDSLSENSQKMGQLLAVHNEKLDNQDKVDEVLFEKLDNLNRDFNRETNAIKKGCERDIRKVDDRLRVMEKKMWSIFGGLAIVSFMVSAPGQVLLENLTNKSNTSMISGQIVRSID